MQVAAAKASRGHPRDPDVCDDSVASLASEKSGDVDTSGCSSGTGQHPVGVKGVASYQPLNRRLQEHKAKRHTAEQRVRGALPLGGSLCFCDK